MKLVSTLLALFVLFVLNACAPAMDSDNGGEPASAPMESSQ